MKLGILLALLSTIAVTSAQSQNYAEAQANAGAQANADAHANAGPHANAGAQANVGAQENAGAWTGAAATKGVRVISSPPGSIIYRQPGSGKRLSQAKIAQAIAKARAAVGQSGQPPSRALKAGHAANPVATPAVSRSKSRPQTHHPRHRAPHNAVSQPAQPASSAPQTDVAQTTTAPTQSATVTKIPQQSPSDKNSQNSSQLFHIPDLSAIALPNLGNFPQNFEKVIQFALTNIPLVKAASGVVTGFLTAQSITVPKIVADIQKGLTDAANVISPENVKKAVGPLIDKSQNAFKAIVPKLAELAVSQVDKIGGLIKNLVLVLASQFAQIIAIGFSVVTTIGLIIQNEVIPNIPIDFSHLALPLEKLPISLDKQDKLPISADKLPVPLDKLPVPLDNLPISLDKLPISIDKLLELFGHKLSSAVGGADNQASPSNTHSQDGQVDAKALSTAKAAAVAPDAAFAEALSAVVAESPEYFGESVEQYEPLSIAG